MSVEGKVALVTGGGNGLGRAIALGLAERGAKVVVNDLGGDWHGEGEDPRAASSVVEEISAAGGEAVADHGSVADSDAGAAMVKLAIDTYGQLDAVINAAGILRDSMLVSMEDEQWDAVVDVHLRGHFTVTRAAAAYWRARSKEIDGPVNARLLCFTSEAGLYGNPGQTNYSAAKGGIASFAITAAGELGRYGVSSNIIAPRARTRMTEGTFGDAFSSGEGEFDAWSPEFVVPAISFLCSDAGGAYSGKILVAGGGTLQTVTPYTPDAQATFNEIPDEDEVAAFLADAYGDDTGPPPGAIERTMSSLKPLR